MTWNLVPAASRSVNRLVVVVCLVAAHLSTPIAPSPPSLAAHHPSGDGGRISVFDGPDTYPAGQPFYIQHGFSGGPCSIDPNQPDDPAAAAELADMGFDLWVQGLNYGSIPSPGLTAPWKGQYDYSPGHPDHLLLLGPPEIVEGCMWIDHGEPAREYIRWSRYQFPGDAFPLVSPADIDNFIGLFWDERTPCPDHPTFGTPDCVTVRQDLSIDFVTPDRKVLLIQGINSKSSCDDPMDNRVSWLIDGLVGLSTPDGAEIGPEDFFAYSYSGFHDACPSTTLTFTPDYSPVDTCDGIAYHADRFRDYIRALAPPGSSTRVDIMAHSMGGVVTASYLSTEDPSYVATHINSVVTFDSPLRGASVESLRGLVFMGGCSFADQSLNDLLETSPFFKDFSSESILAAGQDAAFYTIDGTIKEPIYDREAVPDASSHMHGERSHLKVPQSHRPSWDEGRQDKLAFVKCALGQARCGVGSSTTSVLPGETESLTAEVSGNQSSVTFNVEWEGSTIDTTVIDPNAVIQNPNDPAIVHDTGPTWETYTIANPEPGDWTIELKGTDVPAGGEQALLTISGIAELNSDTIGLVDPTTAIWHLRDQFGNSRAFYYGNPGDYPIVGDWDCDGVATPGMYRSSDGFVYLTNFNNTGIADVRFHFGIAGDIPIAGDWDGDGCDSIGIFRGGHVFLSNSLGANDGFFIAEFDYWFGNPGDKPFTGDFNGDGKDTVGLHRESSGFVYFTENHAPLGGVASTDNEFFFGVRDDRMVAGDWGDVDGVDSVAIFRPSDSTFYFRHTNTLGVADSQFPFGESDWLPVAGFFGFS